MSCCSFLHQNNELLVKCTNGTGKLVLMLQAQSHSDPAYLDTVIIPFEVFINCSFINLVSKEVIPTLEGILNALTQSIRIPISREHKFRTEYLNTVTTTVALFSLFFHSSVKLEIESLSCN